MALGQSRRRGRPLRGARALALSADEAVAGDPRPPVVYLRSFGEDAAGSRVTGAVTEEEQLAEAMSAIGPFIAVGRPGDTLPGLGAARLYVDDRHWQREVSALMEGAGLVVLRIGNTAGLWWEVEQALRLVPRHRLLFLLPVGPSYEPFRLRAARELGLQLPVLEDAGSAPSSLARLLIAGEAVVPEGSIRAAVYFDTTGASRVVVFDRRLDHLGRTATALMFRRDLWPLLRQLGSKSPGRTSLRLASTRSSAASLSSRPGGAGPGASGRR